MELSDDAVHVIVCKISDARTWVAARQVSRLWRQCAEMHLRDECEQDMLQMLDACRISVERPSLRLLVRYRWGRHHYVTYRCGVCGGETIRVGVCDCHASPPRSPPRSPPEEYSPEEYGPEEYGPEEYGPEEYGPEEYYQYWQGSHPIVPTRVFRTIHILAIVKTLCSMAQYAARGM